MAYRPFRNLGLKAIATVVATLLWLMVSRDQTVERTLRVPLEYQNIPANLEIVGDSPPTVDVRVRGASNVLGRLEPGEVVAVLDLRAARAGQRLFHVLTDQVRAPFGVQVAQVSPPTVSLAFERSGRRVVPVVPAVEGEPAVGYVAGKVAADPTTVEVIGPEGPLERLLAATTEPISIQGASRMVRDVVTVGVADAALRLREARSATVTVEILPAPIERTIADVPVSVRNGPPRARVTLTPAKVRAVVRGSRDAVAALGAADIPVFVDLATLSSGSYTLPVKGDVGGLGLVRTEPPAVRVRIR
jgi:YbbR domain-containing protein